VGSRVGLADVKKIQFFTLPGLELRHLSRPVRSQSLYRLLTFHLNINYFTSYLKENTLRLRYKDQPVTVVREIIVGC
jgi:hypothetical protein